MDTVHSQNESPVLTWGVGRPHSVVLKQLVESSLLKPGTQAEALGISVEKCQEHYNLWRIE